MEQNLQKFFKQAKYQPESNLSGNIWLFIDAREKRISKIKSFSYGILGIISFAGLVPAIKNLIEQFAQSGFYQYLSLAFSDLGSISLYWKEFMLSLAETIPATSLILTLVLFFIFLISFKRVSVSLRSPLLAV